MRTTKFMAVTAGVLLSLGVVPSLLPVRAPGMAYAATATPNVAVGPQYDTTHVYVAPADFDRFVASLLATFGGADSGARRKGFRGERENDSGVKTNRIPG